MLALVLNFNVMAIADNASGLQQTQVENAKFSKVSDDIRIWVNRSIMRSPIIAKTPLTLILDASKSTGGNLQFAWDFGDGTIKNGAYVHHTYANEGEYELVLVVSNDVDRKVWNLAIQVADFPNVNILNIPFDINQADFNLTIVEGIASDSYEYIFSPQYHSVLQVEQLYEKQRHIASLYGTEENLVAQVVLLPSHPKIFTFNVENSVRASLFTFLELSYRRLIRDKYSEEVLTDFYESLYPILDDNPNFQIAVENLKSGRWSFGEIEYIEFLSQTFFEYIYPMTQKHYDELE